MARANEEAAELLQEYAELFAMSGGDAFRVRSYQKAAKSIAGFPEEITEENLRSVPGVGSAISGKIEEFLRTGSFHQLERLRGQVPDGVRRLTRIPSLGPKTAMTLYQELGIDSPDALETAIREDRLEGRRGFGPKTLDNLLQGIEQLRQAGSRVHIGIAADVAGRIVDELAPMCERCEYAGSLRRAKDTIGDIDILAVGGSDVMPAFSAFGEVLLSGPTKTSIRTPQGLQVDLRVVPGESWGAALQYFTGSKEHNVRLREIAVRKGWKLSEYGLFDEDDGVIAAAAEEEIYEALGLQWVPPPMREDDGEIELALSGELPQLIALADLKGDLHTHTDLTDGVASLEDMLAAAADRGYAYYAVTDHAPDLIMQRMTLEKALLQRERLADLQSRHSGMRLLHGTELNIDPDGNVDWPIDVLEGFDVCVASIHSHFTQSREEITRRLIRAAENPGVHILGHPTTRKIGKRPPVDADWDEVFKACARTGTALEIDSYPDRTDLPADLVKRARHHGAKFSVDSDAHAVPHLAGVRFGVGTARRGWLTGDDVINTWPLERLQAFLRDRARAT